MAKGKELGASRSMRENGLTVAVSAQGDSRGHRIRVQMLFVPVLSHPVWNHLRRFSGHRLKATRN